MPFGLSNVNLGKIKILKTSDNTKTIAVIQMEITDVSASENPKIFNLSLRRENSISIPLFLLLITEIKVPIRNQPPNSVKTVKSLLRFFAFLGSSPTAFEDFEKARPAIPKARQIEETQISTTFKNPKESSPKNYCFFINE